MVEVRYCYNWSSQFLQIMKRFSRNVIGSRLKTHEHLIHRLCAPTHTHHQELVVTLVIHQHTTHSTLSTHYSHHNRYTHPPDCSLLDTASILLWRAAIFCSSLSFGSSPDMSIVRGWCYSEIDALVFHDFDNQTLQQVQYKRVIHFVMGFPHSFCSLKRIISAARVWMWKWLKQIVKSRLDQQPHPTSGKLQHYLGNTDTVPINDGVKKWTHPLVET